MNKIKQKGFVLFIYSVLTVLVLAACAAEENGLEEEPNDDEANENAAAEQESSSEWPEELVMGVIPAEDQTSVSPRVEQFGDELGEELEIEVDVFMGSNYNAVIEGMNNEHVDIAFFGPFAYTLANERSGAEVFAIGAESEDDITYQSAFIVPADSEAEDISDLEGQDFLFVDPASTSGHIFPRSSVIDEIGITNEEVDSYFGNISFSGSHDASILSVINGDVDGAGIATDVMDAMIAQGQVDEDDFKIIHASDDIPRGPDAYRGDLPEDLKEEIREFYYAYEDEQFFEERGITGFYPSEDADYDIVRQTSEDLGMSPEELLE
ncbi:phosphonate transport system substrate-binding protein [Virgibacillus natechei]|uniref:Phosphonate transport system substrate-binding protein n=1 Tax=Virgibacillus natechei TaxID=1216297 RepID=A0ABS4IDU7_9BACI|nr:phosphate/phosphite/phosphonate ABC transporter substrate-binding protein [Virgibacillus natechei]MBP1968511.1 phosphonate transport system substrate-binding protein [Virgibacillus natechei]UZD13627.1 phosphate/phosphite/phosphonate ABC transporter substrate-binding protein [Virgibacillus natechei]